nr:kielin/chordin-like protein [Salvelinus alpinus]
MVFRSGRRAVVETAAGITLTFDWHSTVHVKLPSTYQGAVFGLCGNYNAMPQVNLTMRDGHPTPNATWLGASWRVALVPGCRGHNASPARTQRRTRTAPAVAS